MHNCFLALASVIFANVSSAKTSFHGQIQIQGWRYCLCLLVGRTTKCCGSSPPLPRYFCMNYILLCKTTVNMYLTVSLGQEFGSDFAGRFWLSSLMNLESFKAWPGLEAPHPRWRTCMTGRLLQAVDLEAPFPVIYTSP